MKELKKLFDDRLYIALTFLFFACAAAFVFSFPAHAQDDLTSSISFSSSSDGIPPGDETGGMPLEDTSQPEAPSSVPEDTSRPETPSSVPEDTSQPEVPSSVPEDTSQPEASSSVPENTSQPEASSSVPENTSQPETIPTTEELILNELVSIRLNTDFFLYCIIPIFIAVLLIIKLCLWFYTTFIKSGL